MNEAMIEQAAMAWLAELGFATVSGLDIGPDGAKAERASYGDVALVGRLRAAIARLNPSLSEDELRQLLDWPSGGVVFTTLQKFAPEAGGKDYPLLSDRRNIVVIADEAHRSQYGFRAKVERKSGDISYGLPASKAASRWTGCTGRPPAPESEFW